MSKMRGNLCDGCKNLHIMQKATQQHDIVDVSKFQRKLSHWCDICGGQENEASSYCDQCEEHLCEQCTHAHKTMKATTTHSLQAPKQFDKNDLCEPCFEGNETIIAESFCIICEERLCASCSKYHRTQKSTKDHAICSVTDRPSRPKTVLCDICPPDSERGIAIKFCDTCDENTCAVCLKQHSRQKATKSHTSFTSPKEHTSSDSIKDIRTDGYDVTEQVKTEISNKELKRPGKPIASKVKADSLELSWTRPESFVDKDTYQVRYKDPDNDNKWKFIPHEYSTSSINVTDMKSNTIFVFQVRMVNEDEEGPYSEPSDPITTLQSPGGRLQSFAKIVEKGNPTKYALPMTELRHARCAEAKSRKFELGS